MAVKLKAFVTLWKRPKVTRICFEGLKRLQENSGEFELSVIAIGSEDVFRDMCLEYGFQYYEHNNKPLGLKCNAGLRKAMEDDFDWLMIVNSDDIISNGIFEVYRQNLDKYMIGLQGCYFYSTYSQQMRYFEGYDEMRMSMGPGRLISREIIEACKGKLWGDRKNRNLNAACLKRIRNAGYDETIINSDKVHIIDIKSGVNLHRFDQFQGQVVDKEAVFSQFSEKERQLIGNL